jgi:hypothetical protein
VLESDMAQNEEFNIAGIKGIKNFHLVRSVGSMHMNKLLTKSLACFCCYYLNLPWTFDWDVEVLVAKTLCYLRVMQWMLHLWLREVIST